MNHNQLEGSIALLDDVVEHMATLNQNGAIVQEWALDAVQTVIARLEFDFREGGFDGSDEENEEED